MKIIAPPMCALVTLDGQRQIVPSHYAEAAKAAGLDIITLDRSSARARSASGGGYYYQSVTPAHRQRRRHLRVMLDVLARKVGVRGVFADWPATVTYYANCMAAWPAARGATARGGREETRTRGARRGMAKRRGAGRRARRTTIGALRGRLRARAGHNLPVLVTVAAPAPSASLAPRHAPR